MPFLLTPKGRQVLRKLFPLKRAHRANHKSPLAVKRSTTTYLAKQGWKVSISTTPAVWYGWYRTKGGSYKGKVTASTPPQFYIQKPPQGLKTKHSHSACFTKLDDDWYSVHFRIMPKDLDSGVIKLERILYEAYLLTQKSA
jgi:hypothetical protein